MRAPAYVIGFLLVVTGLVGYVMQAPSVSFIAPKSLPDGLELTLAAEGDPLLEMEYYSLKWHSPMEQAVSLQDEIITRGNRENHNSWYAIVRGNEENPTVEIFHGRGLSLSAKDWSGATDTSGAQLSGTLGFSKNWTALLPALGALLLIGCVVGSARRRHLLLAAVIIALAGTGFPAKMAWDSYLTLDEVKTRMSELGRHPESQPPSPVRFLSLGVTSVLCFFFTVLSVQSFAKSPKRKPSGPAKTAIERKAEKSRRPDEADKKGDGDDGKQRSPTKGPWLKEKSSQKIPRGNAEGSKPEASKELDKKKLASKPPMTTSKAVADKPPASSATKPSTKPEKPSAKEPVSEKKESETLGKSKDDAEKSERTAEPKPPEPKPPHESKKEAPPTPNAKKDDQKTNAESSNPENVKKEDVQAPPPARSTKFRMTKSDAVRDTIRLNRPKPTEPSAAKDKDEARKTDPPPPSATGDRPKPSPDSPTSGDSGKKDASSEKSDASSEKPDETKPALDEITKIPEKPSDPKLD